MSKVALIRGDDRYDNIVRALQLIKDEVKEKVKGKEKIVIKPNFVHTNIPLCATHVEAVRAVLDVITELTDKTITIAEGSFQKTEDGFRNYGYYELADNYNVRFKDLNTDDFVEVKLLDSELKPLRFRVAKTMVDSDFRISVCPMKTHDTVIVTLSLKNVAVGSLVKDRFGDEKGRIHQGYKAINLNLAKLAEIIPPSLAVIDGFTGMEGNGPGHGDLVEMKIAIASTDFLAADLTATKIMGFDPETVGYFYYLKQKLKPRTELVGNTTIEDVERRFKPHYSYKSQLKWH